MDKETKTIEAYEIHNMPTKVHSWFAREFIEWFIENPDEDLHIIIPNPTKKRKITIKYIPQTTNNG